VAAALVKGTTDVSAFSDDARNDPGIRHLAARVDVRADPSMSLRGAEGPTARVAVTLRDGRILTRDAAVIRGDAANPRPRAELVSKFMALTRDTLTSARAHEVVEMVGRLEQLKDVRELTALLTGTR
jgi:2-methylcitrate dehydratase PrpD